MHPSTPKSLLEKSLEKNKSKNGENGREKKKREGNEYFFREKVLLELLAH